MEQRGTGGEGKKGESRTRREGERGKGHWLLGTLRNFQPPC